MKTIADIKRKMVMGSLWHCLWSCREHSKDMGTRLVVVVQSNCFGFMNHATNSTSYCDWPKRSEVVFISDNSFKIIHGDINLTYTLIKEA